MTVLAARAAYASAFALIESNSACVMAPLSSSCLALSISAALAYACRCVLPLVQVPPRGLWGRGGEVTVTTAEAWLGRTVVTDPSIDDVARAAAVSPPEGSRPAATRNT